MQVQDWFARHRPGRRASTVLAVVVLAVGLATVGYAAAHQQHAPRPPASAAGTIGAARARPAVGPSSSSPVTPAPPPAAPVAIRIASIGVTSKMIQVGLAADGSIEVPQPGPDYDKAAWYRLSPPPGVVGPSIIEGHVDSAAGGPSVFFRLGALRPGDEIDVTLADRSTAVFKVDGVRQYDKAAFPASEIYGNTDAPALRVITCGGTFDRSTGHYRSNVIAFASLSGRRPAS